jgi:replication-associated recombination protein RarA
MSDEFEHLAHQCRSSAKLDADERIRLALTERWIGYPKASFALNRLRHLIDYPARDRMPCLLLYGATGMGKTKILKMFIRSHPVSVTSQTGPSSIPIVLVQMPPEPDEKSFYLELLHAMNATSQFGHTTGQLRHMVRDLLSFSKTRMLMVDEVHSLLAGTYRQQRILLNTLRFLANALQIPMVCAGTAEAKRALLTDQQLADRFEALELSPWINDENFARLLASFQALLPLRKCSALVTAEVRREILLRTDGITVRVVKLIESLAVDAILSGRERIDLESLARLDSQPPLLSMDSVAGASA